MMRLCSWVFAIAVAVFGAAQVSGDSPDTKERDPDEAFRKACALIVSLEAKQDLLKGVSKIKPRLERDEKKRLNSAQFVFERNAVPQGKEAAKAKDDSKPFVHVSVSLWSGRTTAPPAGLHEFTWKGQTYQMWVRIYGSDAKLVKTVRKSIDEAMLEAIAQKK